MNPRNVLVLFAHPAHRRARINTDLAAVAKRLEHVTVADLYAEYPRFKIDIDREQERLVQHDVIVFQFPLYWYSTPSILKEWQDLVLEDGFAYGVDGDRLAGKLFLAAITTVGSEQFYQVSGRSHFPIRTLLSPLEQTANLCRMHFLPPFVLFSVQKARDDGRARTHISQYDTLLRSLRDDQLDLDLLDRLDVFGDDLAPLLKRG